MDQHNIENPMIEAQARDDAAEDLMSECYNCGRRIADPDICEACGEAIMCDACSHYIFNFGKVCNFCLPGVDDE